MTVLTCEQAQEKLFDFLDRELTEEEAALVREHVAKCGPCSDSFASTQDFIDCVKGKLSQTKLPDELIQRIASALEQIDP